MKSGYLSPAKPRFLAHRGLTLLPDGTLLDENTIEAFAAAVAAGAQYLETDVQCSADGVAFAFHDADLARAMGLPSPSDRLINRLSAAEIKAIRLEHGGQIPTLEEVLSRFAGSRINIDVKSVEAIAPTAEVINRLACFDRVLVSSFSSSRRVATLGMLNQPVATSADRDLVLAALLLSKIGLGWLLARVLGDIQALQIPVAFAGISLTGRRFMRDVKRAGVELHYWTINEPAEMRRLLQLGADGIVTDRIDLVLSL